MSKVLRRGIIPIREPLGGFRTTIARYAPVGEDLTPYLAFIENILDNFFFRMPTLNRTVTQVLHEDFHVPEEEAKNLIGYIETYLYTGITRTFGAIYPARMYTYAIDESNNNIIVTEGTGQEVLVTVSDTELDDEDAWVPERLRRR